MKNLNEKRPSGLALLPFAMFIVIYMGAGIYYQVKGMEMAFYQFPSVTAMFLAAAWRPFIMFKGTLNEKFDTFAKGAANVDILTMLMIYILAGAFANVAAVMGGRESTVNLGLSLVPVEFLAAGLFVISAFMGTATGSSMGTVTAVIPIAVGIAEKGGLSLTVVIGAVVGGAMFGDQSLHDLRHHHRCHPQPALRNARQVPCQLPHRSAGGTDHPGPPADLRPSGDGHAPGGPALRSHQGPALRAGAGPGPVRAQRVPGPDRGYLLRRSGGHLLR